MEHSARVNVGEAFQGSLFAGDLLTETIAGSADWLTLDDVALDGFEASFRAVFDRFPTANSPNESQTEDDLIWPVLDRLGWTASLRQQNLTLRGREDVPDGLLFADDAAKDRANGLAEEWKRYDLGLAVVESKRWLRPLDRRSGGRGEGIAPSTQMLRYLRRVDDLTSGHLRWGILTNGARWRLYFQGARSVSEQFFEIDLAALLDLPGHNEGLFALTEPERRHGLKLFILFFRREAFLPGDADSRTLHQRALEEGRFHQERVASNLSDLVFGRVFPDLARAIAGQAPDAPLGEVRDAALVVLYRLLFILYAEDRDLLPVRDERYDDYGLRDKVRGDVGRRKDRGDAFSETAARYWSAIDDLCRAVDAGDSSIGLPPYDGGLFDRESAPLLSRIRLGDRVMSDVIDALSFEAAPEGRRYINYRDLSVQQLGSIYERLLEHEIAREGDEIVVRPNVFARKGSGSYYTPDELVGLILEETIGPLVRARLEAFATETEKLRKSRRRLRFRLTELKRLDPASRLLDLKVCDPAMGSGRPHIKSLSHQYLIAEAIVQRGPNSLLAHADLRCLTLEKIHRHVPNHPYIVRRIAPTNPTLVFTKRHIQSPVQSILHAPVRPHRLAKQLDIVERCNVVAPGDAHLPLATAFRLHHPYRFQSAPPLDNGQSTQVCGQEIAPVLDPTVPLVERLLMLHLRALEALPLRRREIPSHLSCQYLLVVLHRQYVIPASLVDLLRGLSLAIHRVHRHDTPLQFKPLQQLRHRRNLIGLLLRLHLSKDHTIATRPCADHMQRLHTSVAVMGPSVSLAVHCDNLAVAERGHIFDPAPEALLKAGDRQRRDNPRNRVVDRHSVGQRHITAKPLQLRVSELLDIAPAVGATDEPVWLLGSSGYRTGGGRRAALPAGAVELGDAGYTLDAGRRDAE